MKLFIFEPYEWSYCGGAIGVIAPDFESAVDQIMKEDIEQAEEMAAKDSISHRQTKEQKIERFRNYKPEYFQRSPEKFKEDHYDQWLLTHEEEMSSQYDIPEVLFDNWNYS